MITYTFSFEDNFHRSTTTLNLFESMVAANMLSTTQSRPVCSAQQAMHAVPRTAKAAQPAKQNVLSKLSLLGAAAAAAASLTLVTLCFPAECSPSGYMPERPDRASGFLNSEAEGALAVQASPALAGQADFGGVLPKDTPKVLTPCSAHSCGQCTHC